jgi:hypothetical protein
MKGPDLDRERSEEKHSLEHFLKIYNAGLPAGFPRASASLLEKYKEQYPGQFKGKGDWSLDVHRKKFMDWLPMYLKSLEQ